MASFGVLRTWRTLEGGGGGGPFERAAAAVAAPPSAEPGAVSGVARGGAAAGAGASERARCGDRAVAHVGHELLEALDLKLLRPHLSRKL